MVGLSDSEKFLRIHM